MNGGGSSFLAWGSFSHVLLIYLGVKGNLKFSFGFVCYKEVVFEEYKMVGWAFLHLDTHLFGPNPNESKSLVDYH